VTDARETLQPLAAAFTGWGRSPSVFSWLKLPLARICAKRSHATLNSTLTRFAISALPMAE
jgi:hypothetical protein